MDVSNTMSMEVNENTSLGVEEYDKASETLKEAAVKVAQVPMAAATGIYKVSIIARLARYDKLRKAMNDVGVTGMTVTAPRAPRTTQSPDMCRVAPDMEAAATDKGKEAGCRITGTML